MGTPYLAPQSPRLVLRAWDPGDLEALAEMHDNFAVMRHFPAMLTRAQSDALAARWQAGLDEKGWGVWAVELRETGEFLGAIGLAEPRFYCPDVPHAEVLWRLKRVAWGRGYASEGATACLEFGFEQLGLQEIVSFTALTNARSKKVMERIGMHDAHADFDHPGLPPGHRLSRHCLYRITRQEWDVLPR